MIDLLSLLPLALTVTLGLSLLLFYALTGVPPVSATRAEAADVVALLRQAELPRQAIVYELGCGWGTMVVALARAFPDARIVGIELSPLPCWIARLRTRRLANVRIVRGDFHACDLHDAQAVTCYLMINPMPKLAALLDVMLRERTPVVALAFWFRGRDHHARRGAAALYRWPAKSERAMKKAYDGAN